MQSVKTRSLFAILNSLLMLLPVGVYATSNYVQPSVLETLGVGGRTTQLPTNEFLPVATFDNFSFGVETSINALSWQGFYAPDNGGLISQFEISIWADGGPLVGPSTLLFSQIISGGADETLIAQAFFASDPPTDFAPPGDVSIYNYAADLSSAFVAEAGTTYWLQIRPTVGFPPFWAWHFGSGGDSLTVQDFNGTRTFFPDQLDLTFTLFEGVTSNLSSGQVYILPDTNGDGVLEIGILRVDADESKVRLQILNGKDRVTLDEVVWVDNFSDASLTLHVIPDMNNNGVDEVGLFGIQDIQNNEGKPQVFVRDLKTGNKVGEVYNWVANWTEVSALVLEDVTGDGLSEIAIQGRFVEGNRPQLVVKTGNTNDILDTYSYPDLFVSPEYFQHSDTTGDGFAEIATFGRLLSNNKIQIKIANGLDSEDKMPAYNFPDKWDDISWHRLDDSNGDGIDDWGMFGTLREDGRPQLINKDGVSPMGALRIFAWPFEMQNAQFFRIPDMNNDGVDEVAAAGRRSNNDRYQFQVQDGTDRNVLLANHNLNLDLESVTYHVLPDLSGDGQAEVGFMGINSAGEYELVIQHGDAANGEFATHNLGSDWQGSPVITSLGDTDDDGSPDLLVYGEDAGGAQLLMFDPAFIPAVLGTYTTGSVTSNLSNCLDSSDNGPFTFASGSLEISNQNGVNFTGTSIFEVNVGGVSVVSTLQLTGMVSIDGALAGTFEETLKLNNQVDSGSIGTFTGQVNGDTVTFQVAGTDTFGDTCSYSAAATFERL